MSMDGGIEKSNKNKPEIYNKEGRVEDPRVAEEMAYAQKPYQERKRFGMFGPSKETIRKGEQVGERKGLETAKKLLEELRDKVKLQLNAAVSRGKVIGTRDIGGRRYASGTRIREVPLYELDVNVGVAGGGSIKYVGTGRGAWTGEILSSQIELNGEKVYVDDLTPELLAALSKVLGVEVKGSLAENIEKAHRK